MIFGSTTGNTQTVAERIKGHLEGAGHEVTIQNAMDAATDGFENYDAFVWGSSTWNDGELQDDFIEYHMQLEQMPPDLNGKKFAAFGTGESVYEKFCEAVTILEASLAQWGAQKMIDGLMIDGYPEDEENAQKVDAWAKELISKL